MVGAGVIGLTCAVRLLEAGHRVVVVSDRSPGETTSAVAAAMWYPYLAYPPERVGAWAARTYDVLSQIAAADLVAGVPPPAAGSHAGVRMMAGREVLAARTPDPDWIAAVPDFRRLEPHERGGHADGWRFTAPLLDMPRYLGWLLTRVHEAGGQLELRRVTDLRVEATACDVLVNCTGLAARELTSDPSLRPIRGQIVLVSNPGLREWVLDETRPGTLTYVIPRLDSVVCGGTATDGSEDVAVDTRIAAAILRRARELVPALAGATVVDHRVGLRPARPTVRLERADGPGHAVIHCYGHGGAGVTLSWGCAEEVLALVG